ncbi:MAG: hypothetical protein L6R35_001659 [Caloplaca aegaea]|nr:MAG: hypothetical protein L6R35_001659 [Caloplaca aegaea]
MQYLNILVITAISLLQPALSQTIDPSTVDDGTKVTASNPMFPNTPKQFPFMSVKKPALSVVNTSTISTMSATTTDGGAAADATDATAVYTGFGSDSTTATADDSNDAKTLAIKFGKSYGFAMVFISVSVAFTVML